MNSSLTSVLFVFEFETPEEKHLVGEIHTAGYKCLKVGRDQKVYIVSSNQLL